MKIVTYLRKMNGIPAQKRTIMRMRSSFFFRSHFEVRFGSKQPKKEKGKLSKEKKNLNKKDKRISRKGIVKL